MEVLTILVPEQQRMFRSATMQERLPRQQKMFMRRRSPLYSMADK